MGDHICTLPMYAEMTEAQVLTVCTTLEQILRA